MSRWSPKGVAVLVRCGGEGHGAESQADHCMVCAPWWGRYPTCPSCGRKVVKTKRSGIVRCQNKECELAGSHLHVPEDG